MENHRDDFEPFMEDEEKFEKVDLLPGSFFLVCMCVEMMGGRPDSYFCVSGTVL